MKANEMLLLVNNPFRMQVEHSYAREEPVQRQPVNTSIENNESRQMKPEITNETSPTINPLQIIIFRSWVNPPKNVSFAEKENSPKRETKKINSTSETGKEAGDSQLQTSEEIEKRLDQIENMPLYDRLPGLVAMKRIIPDRATSPRIGSRKFRRNPPAKKIVIDDQPVPCSSRTAPSPTILHDKFNQTKILGEGYRESVGNIETSCCTSSKSLNRDTSVTQMDRSRVERNVSARDNDTPLQGQSANSTSRRSTGWIERKSRCLPTRNFGRWEEREMVEYLIENHFIRDAKGNLVWKQMRKDGLLRHRTYHSLNNHFRKYILPRIHQFSMNPKSLRRFRRLQRTEKIEKK